MKVEQLIKSSLKELKDISWENSNATVNQDSRLIFPQYCVGKHKKKKRISEQEARFLFVLELEKQNDFYYSVETPTKKSYRFSDKSKKDFSPQICENGQSASIDVTLYKYEKNEFIRKHLIEFKFGNVYTCKKDFLKLLCDDEKTNPNFYINILENCDIRTLASVVDKFEKSIKHIKDNNNINPNLKILVFIYGENKTNENNLIEYEYDFKTDKIIKIINTEKI